MISTQIYLEDQIFGGVISVFILSRQGVQAFFENVDGSREVYRGIAVLKTPQVERRGRAV